jgi:ATP-dependent Clp protease adapter protein ClpS
MTTKAENREETRTGERASEATEPPWNVILHNDNNPINRVVWRLWRTITGMSMKKATRITWEAHTKGRAVAKTCHKELAELYEERLREKGLTASIESTR